MISELAKKEMNRIELYYRENDHNFKKRYRKYEINYEVWMWNEYDDLDHFKFNINRITGETKREYDDYRKKYDDYLKKKNLITKIQKELEK